MPRRRECLLAVSLRGTKAMPKHKMPLGPRASSFDVRLDSFVRPPLLSRNLELLSACCPSSVNSYQVAQQDAVFANSRGWLQSNHHGASRNGSRSRVAAACGVPSEKSRVRSTKSSMRVVFVALAVQGVECLSGMHEGRVKHPMSGLPHRSRVLKTPQSHDGCFTCKSVTSDSHDIPIR